ncbi:uncharacterized protein J8A68_002388 [[Candida] subhashii]|uniref:Protein YTP1-like C-terminal domain-containing protein n=1 Tax=[Candida] subhashii TaxID=561895 RepID=A0A8J5QD99_9ASCO|nr:uncharacterized protein J8A68_002388 [[Candida] subhashii]KAG7664064.1 hypothetical protein J8A68_002388 [[Candida] subhashii]
MEMDGHQSDDENDDHYEHDHTEVSTTTKTPNATMSPIPHVMHHEHGKPILETHLLPEERLYWENYNTTTYFNVPTNYRSTLYLHIIFALFSIVFIYPITLIFNNLNMRKSYMLSLVIHSCCIIFSLFNYSIFINSIPELYPGNAYSKMLVILFVSTILQLIFAFIKSIDPNTNEYFNLGSSSDDDESRNSLTSTEQEEVKQYHQMPTGNKFTNKLFEFRQWVAATRFHKVSKIGFNLLNWGHFFYFLILVPTGVATFCVYGKGGTVFNLLAHFIKGGVFFAYGILTLARYSGGFSNKGWAWNHKFIKSSDKTNKWFSIQGTGLCTMEMLESSLILFYGSTNIFLEHLANPGGEWSPKDLQHASIAFIFIGCGLCGVLCEIKLNDWRFEQAKQNLTKSNQDTQSITNDTKIIKASPGFSPNPFPILTIFWTGILMSAHEQASPLSTDIHKQWGQMFVLGCAFRFLTYLLMLLSSTTCQDLTKPTRPITELIVAFGLLCGGAIFMESTDPVVLSFEYYGLTAMFTLNVSLGMVTLFMSWVMSVFALKDWLKNKYARKEMV